MQYRVYLWGAGKLCMQYLDEKNDDIEVIGIIDNDKNKQGNKFFDYIIYSKEELNNKQFDYIIVCCAAYEFILLELAEMDIPSKKIIVAVESYYDIAQLFKSDKLFIFSQSGFDEFSNRIYENEREMKYIYSLNRMDAMNKWHIKHGYNYNLVRPCTFNEKIRRMEIDKYGKLETICSDKYRIRDYIKYCGLESILTKIYGAWQSPEEIQFDKLPSKYVLKCNHGCGDNIIHRDYIREDYMKEFLNRHLERDYFQWFLEYHYDGIKKMVFCEELLEIKGREAEPLVDYKYFCCDGEIVCILACCDRDAMGESKHKYYDKNWKELPYATKDIYTNEKVERPMCLNELNSIAEILARPFPFVRVDLYEVNGKVYFGELTFSPMGGLIGVQTNQAQRVLGEMINIDYKKQERESIFDKIYSNTDIAEG